MASVGGSIESVSIRGRTFPVASDADATKKLGGFENEIMANGDGTARIIKTRVPWSIDGLVLVIDDTRADQEFLQEIANGNDYVAISMTLASGFTYEATGIVTGEIGGSTQSATASVTMAGPGELSQQ